MIRIFARMMATRLTPALVIAVGLLAGQALAGEPPFDISLRNQVLMGDQQPAMVLTARANIGPVSVTFIRDDGKRQKVTAKSIKYGKSHDFIVKQEPGKHDYTVEITWGKSGPEIITFPVVVARPMRIDISKDTVDLADGHIAFVANQPVAKVKLEVFGDGGTALLEQEFDVSSAGGAKTDIRFKPSSSSVNIVRLTAYDPYGFYNGIEMTPFFVDIPHEEVTFEFGKADIRPEEEQKLARTLDRIHEALAKFGNEFKARLYVAGYTDTVGSRESNQSLSEKRARSIAHWFLANGLAVRACFQGFGEDALAVPTPDETPNESNRRTLHVLANQVPPKSKTFPKTAWTCL